MASMAAVLGNDIIFFNKFSPRSRPEIDKTRCFGAIKCLKVNEEVEKSKKYSVVKNGNDSFKLCEVVNGMWQTRGGWGNIEAEKAVESMLGYVDAGLTTFDMADIYGLAEELYATSSIGFTMSALQNCLKRLRGEIVGVV